MVKILILPLLVAFCFLNFNFYSETIALQCGPNLSEVLRNTKLSNGEVFLCNVDQSIKMFAFVDSSSIKGWVFKHSNGETVSTAFIGSRDPICFRKKCIKFKLLQVFDYKDIIFDACHPALDMRRTLN